MITDTEKLKKVAERLGRKRWFDFDPSENPAQLIECIEKLHIGVRFDTRLAEWIATDRNGLQYYEGTLADAVIDAIAGEGNE